MHAIQLEGIQIQSQKTAIQTPNAVKIRNQIL